MNRLILAKGKPQNFMLMKERQLTEISANVRLVLKNQQILLNAVLGRIPPGKTDHSVPCSKSILPDKKDKHKRNELKKKLPKYLTTQETFHALGIPSSNFYRNVHKKKLFPVDPDDKQPRYRRSEVIALILRVSHEPGAHTFSKLNKKTIG